MNIPIIANHVALRFAGQVRRQDGRTENLNGGPDFDNVHQDPIRASLMVEPTDTIKSTTIVDYFRADARAGGINLYRKPPGVLGAIVGSAAWGGFIDSQNHHER